MFAGSTNFEDGVVVGGDMRSEWGVVDQDFSSLENHPPITAVTRNRAYWRDEDRQGPVNDASALAVLWNPSSSSVPFGFSCGPCFSIAALDAGGISTREICGEATKHREAKSTISPQKAEPPIFSDSRRNGPKDGENVARIPARTSAELVSTTNGSTSAAGDG